MELVKDEARVLYNELYAIQHALAFDDGGVSLHCFASDTGRNGNARRQRSAKRGRSGRSKTDYKFRRISKSTLCSIPDLNCM